MESVFIKMLNMSIAAGWLILAIILLRLLLKKSPKSIRCILWAMAGVRLLSPFTFESFLSLIPSAETVPQEILYSHSPTIHSGVETLNNAVNPFISKTFAPDMMTSANPLQIYAFIAAIIWIIGIAVILTYALINYIILHRKVREAVCQENRIWLCDHISTPFILGLFRPRIYMPSSINEQDQLYVAAHEYAHIKRHDHWWKMLAFALLSIYWFHPLIWIAYHLFSQDLELACDEKVIHDMGTENKKPYADALINCSASCRPHTACPLAFCEIGAALRVKAILHYKKPTVWIMAAAAILCFAVGICFLTNPSSIQLRAMEQQQKPDLIKMSGLNRSYTITADTALEQVLTFLNEIRIIQTDVSNDQNSDPDKKYQANMITLYYDDEPKSETFFFNHDCTRVWTSDANGTVSINRVYNSKTVRQFFDEQIEKIAENASNDASSSGTSILYTYKNSPEFSDPSFSLSMEDDTFSFGYSLFSSYMAFGTYELTDQTLTLKTSDGQFTYVFNVNGDSFVFDASNSSRIPEYRYSGNSQETESPVPDGAVFTSGTL